jgi:NADH:ubiquinone oxidoreductase subunit E
MESPVSNLDEIIEKNYGLDKENLIMILQAIQHQYNYLPMSALRLVSEKLNIPFSAVYTVSGFYSSFSLKPKGRNIVSVCHGTACHVRGSDKIQKSIEHALGIQEGQTTQDNSFTLESVRCIGCCSLGPVVKINDSMHGRLTPVKAAAMLSRYQHN